MKRFSRPLKFIAGVRCCSLRQGVCCSVHSHAGVEIVFHAVGDGCTRLPKRKLSVPFREQSVIIYNAGEPHDQVMNVSGGEDWCVQVSPPTGRALSPTGCLYLPHFDQPALTEDLRLLSGVHTHPSAPEQTAFNLRASALLLTLVNLHAEHSRREAATPQEQYVFRAEQYIRENLPGIESVAQIARHTGISDHYLRHLFQSLRGKSPVRYLNEIRVDRAKTLLCHSRLPMKQIAGQCGYKDEYYFSAVFRALTGFAPGHYRNRSGG